MMRFATTKVLATGLFAVIVFGLNGAAQVYAQSSSIAAMSPTEQTAATELFQEANQDRASENLPALRLDSALTKAAWLHARRMVNAGTLSHQLPGEPDLIVRVQNAGVHCSTVAENIAAGPSAARINNEWMHSPSHRANLLDPRVNAIGIAVVEQGGRLFAVQDFARESSALTPPQQENQVAGLLQSRGLQVDNGHALAHEYCGGEPHMRPQPKLVMRYSTTDLSHLPPQVEQGIAGGGYHRAAIAACAPANENGFSAYQIVILLF